MAKQAAARPLDTALSVQQALALHQQGRLEEAEAIYDSVLASRSAPFRCVASQRRAQAISRADRPKLCVWSPPRSRRKPGSADVLTNYGVILDALKRHEEALASFDKVLAMRADDAAAITIAATR